MIYERFKRIKLRFRFKRSHSYPDNTYYSFCLELLDSLKELYEESYKKITGLHSVYFQLPSNWDVPNINNCERSSIYEWVIDYPVLFGDEEALFKILEEIPIHVSVEE